MNKRETLRSRRCRAALLGASLLGLVSALAAGLFVYHSVTFDPALFEKSGFSGKGLVITDRSGRELRYLPDAKGERARWVPLAEIPEVVRSAFLAAEDERFYTHPGFDSVAILRAFWSNTTKGRVVSGASTISQQVVRLAYTDGPGKSLPDDAYDRRRTRRRSYRDKLIEMVRSIKLEKMLSKDDILEQYLNRVPMGNNLIGVETASRAYFGTSVRNLNAGEAALLASLPKAPGLLNPYGRNHSRLIERRNWVLFRMAALGGCSSETARLAAQDEPRLRKLVFESTAPHVVDMLVKQGAFSGLVRTTLDLDLQKRVQEILASHAERLGARGASQASAIVIHNPTMQVLAAVGSMGYSERAGGFNNGVKATRSAGSTLKPFLYALALEDGETVTTLLEDTERTYRSRGGQYSPLNFDRREYGPVSMRTALGSSLNLSAVRMLDRLGEERFYELLERIRLINHPERGPEHYGLGMAIGNPEISPEQLAEAYAMLANGGVYRRATYLFSGSAKHGPPSYVMLPQTAAIITDILSDPTARSLTFGRSRNMMDVPFPIAIKTGTSTFYRDLWAAGYTRDHTIVVWVGNFDGSPTRNLSGSTAAMPVFSDIITWLYRQSAPEPFQHPRGIKRVSVCGYSGMRPTKYCEHTILELFIAGTEPRTTCTYHAKGPRRHELAPQYAGWLFDKNRMGSAGKYRLAGFEDDLNSVFHDPWRSIPDTQREPAVRARNVVPLPAAAPPTVQRSDANVHYTIGGAGGAEAIALESRGSGLDVRILYPLDRDRFVIDRTDRSQQIKLQASVARPVPYIDWYVNGVSYRRTGPPYQVYWPLEKGSFRLIAVTPENTGDSVQVTVE